MSETYFHYYEHDNIPCRLQIAINSGQVVAAEGYFGKAGFTSISYADILMSGHRISEADFKAMVVRKRTKPKRYH